MKTNALGGPDMSCGLYGNDYLVDKCWKFFNEFIPLIESSNRQGILPANVYVAMIEGRHILDLMHKLNNSDLERK